jgi:ubiquinol-cytochrome c reductase iron-sulfur subunit
VPDKKNRSHYRLLLKISVKVMISLGLLFLVYVFYGYLFGTETDKYPESMSFSLDDLLPGEVYSWDWGGHRLLVLRRDTQMKLALQQANPNLLDKDSSHSRQPEIARNPARSLHPDYFIALDYGTDLGCPLELVTADITAPVSPWWGGFRDQCRGSWYDLAGRIYKEQKASRNLEIPPHSIKGGMLKLGNNSSSG